MSFTPEPAPSTPAAAGAAEPTKATKSRPLTSLRVLRKEEISAHMIRIVAGGEGFKDFVTNDYSDRYVKIVFLLPGVTYPEPLDMARIKDLLPREHWPATRTYTVRWVDHEAQELAIDFVYHGDEGLAGPWAARAQPGDTLTFSGPGGGYAPAPDADWYLFAGDESAIPAIAASLAALPANARGYAFIEVATGTDVYHVQAPAGMAVTWVFRDGVAAGTSDALVSAVQGAKWLPGTVDVFAHGERGYMKRLREVFFTDHGLERGQVSLSGYWAQGRVEDVFQAEKRLPVGKI